MSQPNGAEEAIRLLLRLGATTIQQGSIDVSRSALITNPAIVDQDDDDTPAVVETELGSEENPYTWGDFFATYATAWDSLDLVGKYYQDSDGATHKIESVIDDSMGRLLNGAHIAEGILHLTPTL